MSNEEIKLAARIADAVRADEQGDGCDISAGLFGPELSAIVREFAARPVAEAGELPPKPYAWDSRTQFTFDEVQEYTRIALAQQKPRKSIELVDCGTCGCQVSVPVDHFEAGRAATSARTLSDDERRDVETAAVILEQYQRHTVAANLRAILAASSTPAEAQARDRLAARQTTCTPEKLAEFADPGLPEVSGNMPAEAPSVRDQALEEAIDAIAAIDNHNQDEGIGLEMAIKAVQAIQGKPEAASTGIKLLDDQIAAWRKEVARLNDLIAHATSEAGKPEAAKGGNHG